MEHRDLGKLKDNVEDALKKIVAKGADITPTELDVATKAVCLIDKIRNLEEDEGYSEHGMRHMEPYGYSGNRMIYPMPPMSYDAYMDNVSRTGDGYSGHDFKRRMLDVLDRMRGEAHNEHEHRMVEDWIRVVSNSRN